MSTEIFCFSGTGNSLAVARDLAQATGAKLTSIAALGDGPANSEALSAGFGVRMPFNYIGGDRNLRALAPEFVDHMFASWKARLPETAATVAAEETLPLETADESIMRIVDSMNLHDTLGKRVWLRFAGVTKGLGWLTFRDALPLMDHAFKVDANCNGCGVCARICPV